MKANAPGAAREKERTAEQPGLPAAIHRVLQSITLLYERPASEKPAPPAEARAPADRALAPPPQETGLYDTQDWGALPLGFLHDSAVGLAELQLAAAQEAQDELTSRVRWMLRVQKKLQSMRQQLEHAEKELTTMENDTAQALTKTESLSQALADVAAKEKATMDFVAVVRQRTQPFDRVDTLEATLGPDPYSYAFTMAANIVASGHEASESLSGAYARKSVPACGKAAPPADALREKPSVDGLLVTLTTLDEAHSYFNLHVDFVESAEYARKTEMLRLNLLLGVRQAIQRTLERCEHQAVRWRERNLSNSKSSGFPSRSHLGLLELAAVPAHHDRPSVSATTTLYERFRATGNDVRLFVEVIYSKAQADGNVIYTSTLDALEGAYISMRLRLIMDALRHDLNTILEDNSEGDAAASPRYTTEPQISQSGSLPLHGHSRPKNAEEVEDDRCAATLLALRRAVAYCILAAQWEVDTFFSAFVDRQPKTSLYTLIASLGDVLLEVFRPLVLQKNGLEELRDILEALTPDSSIINSEEPPVSASLRSDRMQSNKHFSATYTPWREDADSHTEKEHTYRYRFLTPLFDRFHRLHQDVQERLIFKAEAFVFHSIRGFDPSDCDLNYPFLLFADGGGPPNEFSYQMTPPFRDKSPSAQKDQPQNPTEEGNASRRSSAMSQGFQTSNNLIAAVEGSSIDTLPRTNEDAQDARVNQGNLAADEGHKENMLLLGKVTAQPAALHPLFVVTLGAQGGWYGSVQHTIRLLSATAAVITPSAFRSLCQNGVETCLTSIFDAAERIRKIRQESASGGFHQSLFLIKHFLILKEYLTCFRWNRSFLEQHEDDFSDGLMSLGASTNTGWGPYLKELPRHSMEPGLKRALKNKPVDVIRQLDVVLKQQCERFISQGSATTLFPLLKLSAAISEAERHRRIPSSQAGAEELRGRPSAFQNVLLQQLSKFVVEFKESVRWTVPRLLFFLYTYLPSAVTPEEAGSSTLEPAFEDCGSAFINGSIPAEGTVRVPFFCVPDDKIVSEMRELTWNSTSAKPGSFPRASDILATGLRNSISDAIKRIEGSLLERLANGEAHDIDLQQLRKDLNWWSSDDFADRFNCTVRQYEEWMRNQRTQSRQNSF